MAIAFGAIADDLTGGMELAAMLTAGGARCAFVTDPARIADVAQGCDAVVVGLKTRVSPAADAVAGFRTAGEALLAAGARQLFFKYCATFDSTDQGNIGPCADLLRTLTGASLTAFCPSYPEVGRRVFQGHLFYDTMLISESPKRFDPLTPMLDPSLVRTLQRQTATRVGLLPHQAVRGGLRAMRGVAEALRRDGIGFAIADATEPADLRAIAELTWDWPLMTGNSSIAAYYPALWRENGLLRQDAAAAQLGAVHGPGVVLAGSCAERSIEQLRAFERERPVYWIDLQRAIDGEDAAGEVLAWARSHLREGPVGIATSAPAAEVERAQARLGRGGAASFAEELLGRIAAGLHAQGVRRFVVAGGETSGAVLKHLGQDRLHVGPFLAPGVARAVTEGSDPIALCLKSGKLGPVDMLLPMLASMEEGA
jgi:3-dehydrotetronate 4-kinase